jgi:hypothetical protein
MEVSHPFVRFFSIYSSNFLSKEAQLSVTSKETQELLFQLC